MPLAAKKLTELDEILTLLQDDIFYVVGAGVSGYITYDNLLGALNQPFANVAEMTAYDISYNADNDSYYVKETVLDAADGFFVLWRGGDQSANVTGDPANWYAPDVDVTGASGAYQKIASAAEGVDAFDTTADLKANPIVGNSDNQYFIVKESVEDGADGYAVLWRAGDQSANSAEVTWVMPDDDPTGASGAYQITGSTIGASAGTFVQKTEIPITAGDTAVTVPEYTTGLTNKEFMYLINGHEQNPSDYTETNSTTITFDDPLPDGILTVKRIVGVAGGDTFVILDLLDDLTGRDTSLNADNQVILLKETVLDAADGFHVLWRAGDQSASVSLDPNNWIAPDSDPTGASGAYQRIETITEGVDAFDTTAALQSAPIALNEDNQYFIVKETELDEADGYAVLWRAGDQSLYSADENWVMPDDDPTGASGAYQRTGSSEATYGDGEIYFQKTNIAVTAGDTVVTVPEYTLGLTDKEFVYLVNGVEFNSDEYVETNSTTITFNSPLPNGVVTAKRIIGTVSIPEISSYSEVVEEPNTTRTLAITDSGKWIRSTNVSGCTITLPPQSSVAWGDNVEIFGRGTLSSVEFTPGSGVTIDVVAGYELESVAKAAWTLKREAEDEWVLIGHLVETP